MKMTPKLEEAFKQLFRAAKLFELDPRLGNLLERRDGDPKALLQIKRGIWAVEDCVNASEIHEWLKPMLADPALQEAPSEGIDIVTEEQVARAYGVEPYKFDDYNG